LTTVISGGRDQEHLGLRLAWAKIENSTKSDEHVDTSMSSPLYGKFK
jgi:hypothetical protein